jgi:hypothetical protein
MLVMVLIAVRLFPRADKVVTIMVEHFFPDLFIRLRGVIHCVVFFKTVIGKGEGSMLQPVARLARPGTVSSRPLARLRSLILRCNSV